MSFSADYIVAAIEAAIDKLIETDEYLLKVDSSERSITHRLAIHLCPHFPGLDIDCEFNRDGFDPKRLALSERPVQDGDPDAVTVFPDIIVHQRGASDRNLLAIEVKKATSLVNSNYDYRKLKAFRIELGYAFALHIVIGYDKRQQLVRCTRWIDG